MQRRESSARLVLRPEGGAATKQIDRRFADYGFTGGFFLLCQLLVLWALGAWSSIFVDLHMLSAIMPADSTVTGPLVTGFAGALALIAVFLSTC